MKWILAVTPLVVAYYTFTYGMWAWRRGNRSGGIGVFILAAVTLGISFYAIFIRNSF